MAKIRSRIVAIHHAVVEGKETYFSLPLSSIHGNLKTYFKWFVYPVFLYGSA